MGTSASVVPQEDCYMTEELTDPKKILLKSAINGKEDKLALIIRQGMDPNEAEWDFSR